MTYNIIKPLQKSCRGSLFALPYAQTVSFVLLAFAKINTGGRCEVNRQPSRVGIVRQRSVHFR